jgi:hypothetical protein
VGVLDGAVGVVDLAVAEADHSIGLVPDGIAPGSMGASVIFRDRAGEWWRTTPDGRVEASPQPESPAIRQP